jgi:hypothetical protein
LWADRFDRPLADLFSVQDEIVDSLASQLRGEDHEDEDDGERSDEGRSRSSCRRSYSGCPRPVKLRGQLGAPMARGAIWVSAGNRRSVATAACGAAEADCCTAVRAFPFRGWRLLTSVGVCLERCGLLTECFGHALNSALLFEGSCGGDQPSSAKRKHRKGGNNGEAWSSRAACRGTGDLR